MHCDRGDEESQCLYKYTIPGKNGLDPTFFPIPSRFSNLKCRHLTCTIYMPMVEYLQFRYMKRPWIAWYPMSLFLSFASAPV